MTNIFLVEIQQKNETITKPKEKRVSDQNQHNNKKKPGKGGKPHGGTNKISNFKGALADLNGYVFELGSETTKSNQYNRTLEEIINYMTRKYYYGGYIGRMLRDFADIQFDKLKPTNPGDNADKTNLRIWEKGVDEYAKRMTANRNNKEALYSIIWGQCSESMQSRLKTFDDYDTISEARSCLELLSVIKGITYKFETQRYPYEALFDVLVSFYQNR